MKQLRSLLQSIRKPSILMPLLSVLFIILWIFILTDSNRAQTYDLISKDENLILNHDLSKFSDGMATNWKVSASGELNVETEEQKGKVDKGALKVSVSDYTNGSAIVYTPRIKTKPNTGYFYKAFYITDTKFDLVVEKTSTDGSVTTEFIKNYPDYDYPLSTMSGVTYVDRKTESIRFAVTLSTNGYLQIDSAYAITKPYEKQTINKDNLLKDSLWEYQQPSGIESKGQKKAVDLFTNEVLSANNDSQAGWLPRQSVPVNEFERYRLKFDYSSDTIVQLGLDYELSSSKSKYVPLREFSPNSETTEVTIDFTINLKAINVKPSLQLSNVGKMTNSDIEMYKLAEAKSFNKPRVSITFDDGWLSSYQNGARIADAFNFETTFYINPGTINNPGFVSDEHVAELLLSNHQVASHGQNHIDLTLESRNVVNSELVDAHSDLSTLKPNTSFDFASAFGKIDYLSMETIRSTYRSHRGTERGINTAQNFDVYNLKVLFIDKETSAKDIQFALNKAHSQNGWLILVYHGIEPSDDFFTINKEIYTKHLELIKKSKIQVQTVDSVLRELNY